MNLFIFTNENLDLIEKYLEIIGQEYMKYLSYDEKLEPESKAIRKRTLQNLRTILKSIRRNNDILKGEIKK